MICDTQNVTGNYVKGGDTSFLTKRKKNKNKKKNLK